MAGPGVVGESYAKSNIWLTAVVATLPTFMEVLNTSVANVTLPQISGSLSAGVEDATWVLTSYLIANAVAMPLSGWCGAVLGRRNFFVLCVIGFSLASLLCGMAPSLGWLVFFRVLQGLAGGGMQPITQAILVDTFPVQRRAMGMAVFGLTVVIAPIIGPVAGGWIAEDYSWRWIFLVNLPIGAVAAGLAWWLIADPPWLRRRGRAGLRIDHIGIGLLCLGLGCMQLFLDLGERSGWFAADRIFVLAVLAGLGLVLFVVWELRHPDPILNLRLLRERNFALACGIMLLFGLMLYSTTVVLPMFTQAVLGYTPMLSGEALAPGGIATMILMPVVGALAPRMDARWMVAGGFLVIALSLVLMGGFTSGVDYPHVALARALQGVGLAFTFVPINALAYAFVPKEVRSEASSILSLARNIGASIGIALSTAMVVSATAEHRSVLVGHLTPYDQPYVAAVAAATAQQAHATGDPVHAWLAAQAGIAGLAALQTQTLAFVDQFRWLGLGTLFMVPLVLLMRRVKTRT